MTKHKNGNKKMYIKALKASGTSFVLLASTFIFIFISMMSANAETYAVHTWVYPDDGEVIRVNLLPSKTMRTPISKLNFGDDTFAYAFCTDVHHPLNSSCIMSLDDDFFSDWRITWLVNNYPPSKSSRIQQAARQAALWYFSDGYTLDPDNPTGEEDLVDDAVRDAYNAILASVPDTPPPEYEPGNINFIIEPASETNFLPGEEKQLFTVRLMKSGHPLIGYAVNVSSTLGILDKTSNITDNNGEAKFTLTCNTTGTATITAKATVTLPAGSRFIHRDDPLGKQRLVLSEEEKVTVQSQAMKTWIEADNLIIAHKFEDKNYNSIQDSGEANLPNWQFTLITPNGSSYTSWTDSSGNAYFYNKILDYGIYTLTETLEHDWKNRTSLNQSRNRSSGDEWTRWVADFGNAQCSLITVITFLDLNMDSLWNKETEPVLPEWQVSLYDWVNGEWTQYDGGTTGSDGRLTFSNLDVTKHYKVVENLAEHPGYWLNTTSLEQEVKWSQYTCQHTVVEFGNIQAIPRIDVIKKVWNGQAWTEHHYEDVGEIVTFNLTILNNGTTPLVNIWVNDTLPECLNYTGESTKTPVSSDLKHIHWFFNDTLGVKESVYIEFNASVVSPGENVNKVNGTANCVKTSNRVSDEDDAIVEGEKPGIRIEKTVWYNGEWTGYAFVDVNTEALFKLVVTNNGNESLIDVYVNDTLPDGLSNSSWMPANVYSRYIPKLGIEESQIFYFNAAVTKTGLIINTGKATGVCENTSKEVSDEDDAIVEGEKPVTPPVNRPPNKPTNPSPSDGSKDISINPMLSVAVSDPDADSMDAHFYSANGMLIGTDENVPSGNVASVIWQNLEYNRSYLWYVTVNDAEYSTKSSTWSFDTIPSLTANHPPNKPTNPSPSDGATNISSNPILSVTVSDPDEDSMDVHFYSANGTLIGTDENVPSGNVASVIWQNLEHSITYSWYAVADDGEYTTTSATWSFTIETSKSSGEDNYILWWILITILIILLITLIYVRYVLLEKKRRAKRVPRHKKI